MGVSSLAYSEAFYLRKPLTSYKMELLPLTLRAEPQHAALNLLWSSLCTLV